MPSHLPLQEHTHSIKLTRSSPAKMPSSNNVVNKSLWHNNARQSSGIHNFTCIHLNVFANVRECTFVWRVSQTSNTRTTTIDETDTHISRWQDQRLQQTNKLWQADETVELATMRTLVFCRRQRNGLSLWRLPSSAALTLSLCVRPPTHRSSEQWQMPRRLPLPRRDIGCRRKCCHCQGQPCVSLVPTRSAPDDGLCKESPVCGWGIAKWAFDRKAGPADLSGNQNSNRKCIRNLQDVSCSQ